MTETQVGRNDVPRVRMSGITKTYGAARALDGVDFELRRGEVMALLGENGAGKSTLVKILSGLITPDNGAVEIDGESVHLTSAARSQSAGIAVVQQEYSSVPALSVAENLALGDSRSGWWWGKAALRRGVRDVLDRVGLTHVAPSTQVEHLSVGEVQLLELARMLRRDARILILDEPTAALSDHEIRRVLSVLRGLADEGRSVIYVTHRLDEVFALTDRVTVFKNGRNAEPRLTSDLDRHSLVTLMLGREMESMFPERPPLKSDRAARITLREADIDGMQSPVSLTVREGEIHGLTGSLGSGAAQVVRALAGLAAINSGDLEMDGAAVPRRLSRADGVTRGIAYCSDDRKLDGTFAEISVRQNLSSSWLAKSSRCGWLDFGRERRIATDICEKFAIAPNRLNSKVGTLSGGNQQKVVLGKWLGADPRVLLIEEPTRGVDVGARAEIYSKLRELSRDGTAIVVCSSDSTEILGFCDMITGFYRGRASATRSHEDWTVESLMHATMHDEAAGV